MLNNPFIRLGIWLLASGFFMLASFLLVVELGPPPTGDAAMRFMTGMMQAMQRSLMGFSMTLEGDPLLQSLIRLSAQLTVPLVGIGLVLGLVTRQRRRG